MVLTNTKIRDLIKNKQLLDNVVDTHVKNASYTISVGKVFRPDDGTEIKIGCVTGNKIEHFVKIKPGEIVVIMSKEKLTLPLNLCASYNSSYSISKMGLSLVNNSIIEPGYCGYLTCILANFSKNDAKLQLNQPIVKLLFYELAEKEEDIGQNTMEKEIIDQKDYARGVSIIASDFHNSFLDLETLEKRVVKSSTEEVKKQVTWGGVIIGFLLLFATLQPFISKWIYSSGIEENYTLKGELIERILKLEKLDTLQGNEIKILQDSLNKKR